MDDLHFAASTAAPGADSGPAALLGCLVIVARHRGIHLSVSQLVHDHQLRADEPSPKHLVQIAKASGLRTTIARLRWRDLMKMGPALPAILVFNDGSSMVLLRSESGGHPPQIVLQDPNAHEDALLVLDEARLAGVWSGETILVKRDYSLRDEDRPFGWGLIFAQLLRDRRTTVDLVIAGFSMGLLAAAPILFWRLLIDRVLYYQTLNTFWVLCAIFGVLLIFDTAFGYLRRFLVARVVARNDARVLPYIYEKLLNLPIDFFERTPVGLVARDIYEYFKIRSFITTQIFGTALDALVIVVFLPIMFAFSPLLTWIILAATGLVCLWVAIMLPHYRRVSGRLQSAEGARGAFLIESLHGMRTVKSLALDAGQRQRWDVHVAKTIRLRFAEMQLANVIQTVVSPFERFMVSGVIAVGVYMAITTQNQVYVGALVAFMLLTQRVIAPLVQLSHMLQQIDEARLAVRQIAGVVNQLPEEGRSKVGIRTPFIGRVEFVGVRFQYRGSSSPALNDVSFKIPEGTIFGVMGRSGSGKTTVTRLLQMLHSNFEGLIKIDGNDIREIDVDHLRGSIGVVLQENFLFTGTIRETIACAKPNASFEEIVRAARMAGAEEFIERLPRGYETFLQEGSANLSGGQRQRLAIARALIMDPPILILDEATSALDAESEAIVNANLLRIAKNRTLIIISHRLSALIGADNILVLERGSVYDIGRHDELVERCDIYSNLWHQQHRHILSRPAHEIIPFRPGAAS